MPRKDEERDLISVEDCVVQASISLESYVQSSEEELLKTVSREGVENQEMAAVFKQGDEMKIFKKRKENRYMGNLWDRVKAKEVSKPSLG